MALSPETRHSDLKGSLKKYFVDNLETTSEIKLFLKWIPDVPVDASGNKLDQWAIIILGDHNLGTVAECFVEINLFTRNDNEGDDLTALYDLLMNYIIDEGSSNGLVSIPYYDISSIPWVKVGGIIPFINRVFGAEEMKDNTHMKTIHLLCKWGSK